jgi:hypothetical protein
MGVLVLQFRPHMFRSLFVHHHVYTASSLSPLSLVCASAAAGTPYFQVSSFVYREIKVVKLVTPLGKIVAALMVL